MPFDISFPPPSTDRCPRCDGPAGAARCGRCGLVLAGDTAQALWRIDRELHDLTVRRRELLGRLDPVPVPAPPPPPPPPSPLPTVALGPPGPALPAWASTRLTLANLLLGLGTALVVVAAIVFTAVRWSQLGSLVQALALFVLTVGTGWLTRILHRHGLSATAEAVSLVTVALLPVDVHAVREAALALSWTGGPAGDPLVYWCLAVWAFAGLSWWFGRLSGTRAPRIVAAVAAQVPVPLYVVLRPVEAPAGQLLCLAQAALAVLAVRRAPRAVAGARTAGVLGAAGTWLVVTPVAAAVALDGGPAERVGGAGVLAAAAAVACLVAALWSDDDRLRPPALATATAVALAAVGIGISAAVTGAAWWAVAAGVCAVVLVAAVRLPRRWGEAPAAVAAALGALASLPVAGVALDALVAADAAAGRAWDHQLTTATRALVDLPIELPAAGLVVAHLAVLAAAVVGVARRIGRDASGRGLAVLACVAVLVTPLVADLTVAAAVALTLVGVSGALAAVTRPGGTTGDVTPVAALAGLAAVALLWGAANPATTLVAVGVVGAAAVGLALCAVRDGARTVALTATAAAVVAVVSDAGLAAAAAGASAGTAWIAAGLAAAGATLVASAAAARRAPVGAHDLVDEAWVTAQATGVGLHLLALTAAISLAGPGAVAVLVLATAVVAAWSVVRALREAAVLLALAAAPALAVALCAEAGLVTAARGGTDAQAWLAVGLAGAAASLAFAAADWPGTRSQVRARVAAPGEATAPDGPGTRGDVRGRVAASGEATAAAAHLVALVALASLGDADRAGLVLAVGAATAAVHALRPGRRGATLWAAAEALVLVWVRLAGAAVDVPEAYTAPAAAALLVGALVVERSGRAGHQPSWVVHGPWLGMALVPTVLVALDDPGLTRPLGGLVAGALVLVGGAVTRRRAAVDIGAATVVLLGLRQLAPVVAELPNWATLGACGLLLLAVGGTFEERRRDLTTIRDRYGSLV